MIFITVGTQAPFDRLIKSIDSVSEKFSNIEFIAQVLSSNYMPRNIKTYDFLNPKDFDALFNKAELIIGHAGMGTIISALTKGKPLVIMPRQAELGEHRNNHQVVTAHRFKELEYVHVFQDEVELSSKLIEIISQKQLQVFHRTDAWASVELIDAIKKDIHNFSLNK